VYGLVRKVLADQEASYQGKILAVTNVLVQVSAGDLKCEFLYRYMSCPRLLLRYLPISENFANEAVQEGRCVARKGEKERKTSGVKTLSELARPLASAYVCPCGHRERAHPAPSAAVNCYFQHF